MRILTTLLSLLAMTSAVLAADPTVPNPAKNPRFFWTTITHVMTGATEEVLGTVNVEDVQSMSVLATVTSTDAALAGDLYLFGSSVSFTTTTGPDTFAVDDRSSIQTWSSTGAQSTIWIEDIKPCRYLGFTSVVPGATTTPCSISLKIRGYRLGEGGQQ